MNSAQHNFDATIIAVSKKVTSCGGVTAFSAGAVAKTEVVATTAGSLNVAEICALGGLGFALAGFLVSTYFQWKRDRRETAEWKRRMTQEEADRIIEIPNPSE